MQFPLSSRRVLAAAVLSTATTTAVHADLEVAVYGGPNAFMYLLTGMSDHDQVRATQANPLRVGLPGNGSMYCVPTATMNMFTYAANHGYAQLNPGPGYWQAGTQAYNDLGTALGTLGGFMSTSASGGTNGSGQMSGIMAWLLLSGALDDLTVTRSFASGNFAPQFADIARAGIDGGLVTFCYGRYEITGTSGPYSVLDRQGGHCVTMNQAQSLDAVNRIWYRDPADGDADSFNQASYTSTRWDLAPVLAQTSNSILSLKVFWSLDQDFNDGRFRLIDSYTVIRPKAGFAFTDTGVLNINPGMLGGQPGQLVNPINPTHDGPIGSAVLDFEQAGVFVLQTPLDGDPPFIDQLDRLAGTGETILTVPGATALATGRFRDLFVLTTTGIDRYDLSADQPLTGNWPLDCAADAIGYDDSSDRLFALCIAEREIRRLSPEVFDPAATIDIPATVPVSGDGALAIHPQTGDICLLTDAAPTTIYCLHEETDGSWTVTTINVKEATDLNDFAFDDVGNVVAIDDNGWYEFALDGGEWQRVLESRWADAPGGQGVLLTRSRTNYRPELHSGPAWNNIDPVELEAGTVVFDCLGDLDRDGTVGFTDLVEMLASWGPCPAQDTCSGDLDDDGGVGFNDLVTLLSNWGDCP